MDRLPQTEDAQSSTGNNFEAVRWLAASLVVVAHAYGLEGRQGLYNALTGVDLGWSAVIMFFTVSGFLICKSAQQRGSLQFWIFRVLRIYPGLIVCTVSVALLLSGFSALPVRDYLTNRSTWHFAFGTGTLVSTQYTLPGVFEGNHSDEVNGSLWTLRYELACYAFVFFIVKFCQLARRKIELFIGILCAGLALLPTIIQQFSVTLPAQASTIIELLFPFLLGSLAQVLDVRSVQKRYIVASLVLSMICHRTAFRVPAIELCISLATFHLAFSGDGVLRRLSGLPDYSYGIYIYAFPIQQLIIIAAPTLPSWLKAVIALIFVLLPASLSWHWVEKPGLSLKRWFSRRSGISCPAS